MNYLRLALCVLALVFGVVGEHDTQAPGLETRGELAPSEIVRRTLGVYATCESYRDRGVVTTVFIGDDGAKRTTRRPFETAFARPGKFSFEFRSRIRDEFPWHRYVVCSDGESVVEWRSVGPRLEEGESLSQSLSTLAGVSGGSATAIPSLLISGPELRAPASLLRLGRVEAVSEDSVPGGARKVECYKVEFEAANQPQHRRIVWIAKDSYLIRQVFESKRIVRRSAATRRASGSNSLTVETVLSYAPELDVDIPIERFTFRAPDSSEEMDDGLNGDRESDSRVTSTIELLDGTTLDDWVLYTAQRGVRKDAVCRIEDGVLRTNGQIRGCLQTKRWYSDYVLEAEWRWEQGLPGGDGGVLVHATAPLVFEGWSRSLEIELATGNAGDFWVVGGGVDIRVEDEELRRAWPWAGDEHSHRRIRNLTDGSEKPIGEWNHLQVTCDEGEVTVFINGEFANRGTNCTETEGAIALKLEGTPIQFRSIRLKPLPR